ncbi:MAG: FeoC-like transcriptional regulator [Acidithiobacillus sp.]
MKPLFAVREVLLRQGMASASQMAAELKLSVGLVEDMLAYWQCRGAVEPVLVGTHKSCGNRCNSGGCGSCSSTPTSSVQAYRWCGVGGRQ